jgi:hypothetical protein
MGGVIGWRSPGETEEIRPELKGPLRVDSAISGTIAA